MLRSMFSSDIKLVYYLAKLEFPYQEEKKIIQYLFHKYLLGSFNVPKTLWALESGYKEIFPMDIVELKNTVCTKSVTLS